MLCRSIYEPIKDPNVVDETHAVPGRLRQIEQQEVHLLVLNLHGPSCICASKSEYRLKNKRGKGKARLPKHFSHRMTLGSTVESLDGFSIGFRWGFVESVRLLLLLLLQPQNCWDCWNSC